MYIHTTNRWLYISRILWERVPKQIIRCLLHLKTSLPRFLHVFPWAQEEVIQEAPEDDSDEERLSKGAPATQFWGWFSKTFRVAMEIWWNMMKYDEIWTWDFNGFHNKYMIWLCQGMSHFLKSSNEANGSSVGDSEVPAASSCCARCSWSPPWGVEKCWKNCDPTWFNMEAS